jgi:hypothetical protein
MSITTGAFESQCPFFLERIIQTGVIASRTLIHSSGEEPPQPEQARRSVEPSGAGRLGSFKRSQWRISSLRGVIVRIGILLVP